MLQIRVVIMAEEAKGGPVDSVTLYDLFKKAAFKYPENQAVCFRTEHYSMSVSYHSLLIESEKISDFLNDLGVKKSFIGVHLKESVHLPALLLGILRSGLAFTCLKVEAKEWNLHYEIKHLDICWLFSETNLQDTKWSVYKTFRIHDNLVKLWKRSDITTEEHGRKYKPTDLNFAYAIQTSGTTGKPKIVRVPHTCIVPNVQDLLNLLSIEPEDVIFLNSPITFDPFIIELFLALSAGALLLMTPHFQKFSSYMKDILSNVTVLQATPSFMILLSKEEILSRLLSKETLLRILLLGGEPCPSIKVLKEFKAAENRTNVYNIYGITEVSCWASIHKISFIENPKINSEDDNVPLGDALALTSFKVKDESDSEGELFIGSMERFCIIDDETFQDLCFPVYRATGDIVKVDRSTGKLFYVRRKNSLVKRFGERVVLNKIEKVVLLHNSVKLSHCIWDEINEKLGLFLKLRKLHDEKQNFLKEIRLLLSQHVPPSHMPDIIMTVDSYPITSHGKLDNFKLKHLMAENIEQSSSLLETEDVHRILSTLWSDHLNLEKAGNPDSSFIQAGGNSILAIQLVTELERRIGSSVCAGLRGMLLGHATFKDCFYYVISKLHKNTSHYNESYISMFSESCFSYQNTTNKRKFVNNTVTSSNKSTKIDEAGSNQNNENVLKTDLAEDVLVSICRGKIDLNESLGSIPTCKVLNNFKIEVKWKFNMEKCVDASPRFLLLQDGGEKILVGSHSCKFIVINNRNGEPIAECVLNNRIESSVCVSHCGKIGVVGCYDGCVYGININSGAINWTFNTAGIVKSSAALCLNSSAIVIGSYDHHIYCINIANGQLVWSNIIGEGSIYASPCVSAIKSLVYVATLDGVCAALKQEDGHVVWKNKLGSPIFSSPAVIPDESVVVFAEVSGLIHFFSSDSGKEFWKFKADGNIFSSICIQPSSHQETNFVIFGCHDNKVYCVLQSSQGVDLKWKCELDSAAFSTPYIFPSDHLHEQQRVFYQVIAASTKGSIYIINSDYGKTEYSFQLPGEVFSSPVVFGNQIYVGCRDNYLYALDIISNNENRKLLEGIDI